MSHEEIPPLHYETRNRRRRAARRRRPRASSAPPPSAAAIVTACGVAEPELEPRGASCGVYNTSYCVT